jgi:hypothetical protein
MHSRDSTALNHLGHAEVTGAEVYWHEASLADRYVDLHNLNNRTPLARRRPGRFILYHNNTGEAEMIVLRKNSVAPVTYMLPQHERIRGRLSAQLLSGDEGREYTKRVPLIRQQQASGS